VNLEEAVDEIFKQNPKIGRISLRKKLAKQGFKISEMDARIICKEKKGTHEENDINIPDETLINLIQQKGYFVTKKAKQQNYTFEPNIVPYSGDIYCLGIVSDTHLGSKYQQLTHLHTFYELCEERGIKTILHCGDMLDGEKMYRGHEYELFLHGADSQVDYVIDNYPEFDGKTYFICGTHEESFWKHSGIDVGIRISEKRKDLHYIGYHGAYLSLLGIDRLFYIHHGSGGVAYARSYKIQKLIEQLGEELKPLFLLEGHFHVSCILPGYKNVFAIQMPCFQSQTPYLLPKGLFPEVGGVVLEIIINKEQKPVSPKVEFILFDKVHKEDF
jgi:hypothetical protein